MKTPCYTSTEGHTVIPYLHTVAAAWMYNNANSYDLQ